MKIIEIIEGLTHMHPVEKYLNDHKPYKLEKLFKAYRDFVENEAEVDDDLSWIARQLFLPQFEAHVEQMDYPAAITAEELFREFNGCVVRFVEEVEFMPLYQVFCSSVRCLIRKRTSEPIRCLKVNAHFQRLPVGESRNWLWSSDPDFNVLRSTWIIQESGSLPSMSNDQLDQSDDVFVTIYGECSDGAMKTFIKEVDGILRVIYASNASIYGERYSDAQSELILGKATQKLSSIIDGLSQNDDEMIMENSEEQAEYNEMVDEATRKITLHGNEFYQNARELLSAFFNKEDLSKKKPKDSIPRRIKIALKLMAKAEEETDYGLSLALFISSMEAFINVDSRNIKKVLSESVAILFEPILEYRSNAEEFVSDLYTKRSNVLHGSYEVIDRKELHKARFLAYAVLIAIVERWSERRKLGFEYETPHDLLRELKKNKYVPRQPDGVKDSPVVELWRKVR